MFHEQCMWTVWEHDDGVTGQLQAKQVSIRSAPRDQTAFLFLTYMQPCYSHQDGSLAVGGRSGVTILILAQSLAHHLTGCCYFLSHHLLLLMLRHHGSTKCYKGWQITASICIY